MTCQSSLSALLLVYGRLGLLSSGLSGARPSGLEDFEDFDRTPGTNRSGRSGAVGGREQGSKLDQGDIRIHGYTMIYYCT